MKLFLFFSTLLLVITNIQAEGFSERKLNEKLKKIEAWEKQLSKTYFIHFVYDKVKLPLEQKVTIKQCNLTLRQYTIDGLLYKDEYDLRKKYIHAKKFKKTYSIAFGLKSILNVKSKLFFPSRAKRNVEMKKFRALAKLCKKPSVYFYFRKLRKKTKKSNSDQSSASNSF